MSDNEAFNRCYDIAGPAAINSWANNLRDDDDRGGDDDGGGDDGDWGKDDDGDDDDDDSGDGGDGVPPREACAVRHRLYSAATNLDNAAYLPAVWAKVKFLSAAPASAAAAPPPPPQREKGKEKEEEEEEEGEARWVRILPARTDPTVDDPRHPKVPNEDEDEHEDGTATNATAAAAAAAAAAGAAGAAGGVEKEKMEVGTAHITPDGVRVDAPLDCSGRNRATLASLQEALVRIARPDLAAAGAAATAAGSEELSEPHRRFLLDVMSQYPR